MAIVATWGGIRVTRNLNPTPEVYNWATTEGYIAGVKLFDTSVTPKRLAAELSMRAFLDEGNEQTFRLPINNTDSWSFVLNGWDYLRKTLHIFSGAINPDGSLESNYEFIFIRWAQTYEGVWTTSADATGPYSGSPAVPFYNGGNLNLDSLPEDAMAKIFLDESYTLDTYAASLADVRKLISRNAMSYDINLDANVGHIDSVWLQSWPLHAIGTQPDNALCPIRYTPPPVPPSTN